MISTLMNSGFILSMGMFFTIIVVGLTSSFPPVARRWRCRLPTATPLIPATECDTPDRRTCSRHSFGYNPVQTYPRWSLPGPALPRSRLQALPPSPAGHGSRRRSHRRSCPRLSSRSISGRVFPLFTALLCVMRVDKYEEKTDGTGRDGGSSADPQEVSGEKT